MKLSKKVIVGKADFASRFIVFAEHFATTMSSKLQFFAYISKRLGLTTSNSDSSLRLTRYCLIVPNFKAVGYVLLQ